ncbi:hypothetical protein PENSPDRAFT_751287 [Peniophora sp. CONT]|nr:hypothetical protein PENSPDRAFT_751287 [Peniophora sp. CONT]
MDYWLDALESRSAGTPSLHQFGISSASLHAWDEELELLNCLMRAARLKRNGLSPTAALPPETLAHIFELLSKGQTYDSNGRAEWSFMAVSHVCTRWRNIAITTPSLWTHLSPSRGGPPWEVSILRSGCLPLSVDGSFWNDFRETLDGRQVVDNLHRIRELKLSVMNNGDPFPAYFAKRVSRDTTPQLATLILAESPNSYNTPVDIPFMWRLDDLPLGLEHLMMSPGLIAWSPFASNNLRYLDLCGGSSLSQAATFVARYLAKVDLSDVLRSLRSIPRLEYLRLDSALPSADAPDSEDAQNRVELPHLRTFYVRDEAHRCVQLWSMLQLNPLCSVQVICTSITRTDELEATIRSHFMTGEVIPFRRASVTTVSRNRNLAYSIITIELSYTDTPTVYREKCASRAEDGPPGFFVATSTTFHLEIESIFENAQATVNRQSLLLAVPLTHVAHLTLGLPLSVETTRAVLRRAHSVTTLVSAAGLVGDVNQGWISVCLALSDGALYEENPLLPALETLTFMDAEAFYEGSPLSRRGEPARAVDRAPYSSSQAT